MNARIAKHSEILKRFFGLPETTDTSKLYAGLRLLEKRGTRLSESYCNGAMTSEGYDAATDKVKRRLREILGESCMDKVYLNGDPRGYFLKINDKESLAWQGPKDMGGYGLIAPDMDHLLWVK